MVVVMYVGCVGVRGGECKAYVGESRSEVVGDLREFGGDGLVGGGAVLDLAGDHVLCAHEEDGHGGGGLVERCAVRFVAANVDEDDGAAEWAGRAIGLQANSGHGRCFVTGQGNLGVDHHRPGPVGHGEGDDKVDRVHGGITEPRFFGAADREGREGAAECFAGRHRGTCLLF